MRRPPSRGTARAGARHTLAWLAACCCAAAGQDLAFVVPAEYPGTAFMELVALRRTGWPMVWQNVDPATNTLFVPTVAGTDGSVCGFVPVLRNTACFPAGFHWLANFWPADRSTFWLQLHSVPAKHVTHEAALVAPCVALALPAAHAVQAALPAALQ